MPTNLIWKSILIAVILALCGLALYPLDRKVKPGLDLAGGTTFLYEVEVPEGVSTKKAIEQTISVLSDRVDPNGVRSLVWRAQGGNRIEIQMPAPSKTAGLRRAQFLALHAQLLKDNLSLHDLDSALAQPAPQRDQALDRLAGQNADQRKQLAQLAAAFDLRAAALAPYTHAQNAKDQAETAFNALSPDAAPDQREQLKLHRDSLIQDLIQQADKFRKAQSLFESARKSALTGNIDPAEADRILALPTKPTATGAKDQDPSPRQTAINKFIQHHPTRARQIQQLADAHQSYEQVKGPLDDPNDLIALLRGSGVLEFRVAAAPSDPADLEQYRDQLHTKGPRAGTDKPYRWFVLDKPETWAQADTPSQSRARLQAMAANPELYFTPRGLVASGYGGEIYLLLANSSQDSLTKSQPGWELGTVYASHDDLGRPAVGFGLNAVGAQLMGALTGNHIKRPMAIVLDNRIISAPNIQSKISSSGIITGGSDGFDQKELDYLVRTLSAGSLQSRLSDYPISIQQTGAAFGQDNLRSGLQAALWSLILVCAFMTLYYFFWGMVANFAMLANLLLVMGVMAMLDATYTLPGIAGLVLTIGMAVDANVLIYERIREELERNADVKTAVRLGFNKAFATIIDANLTTLITCIILGYTATSDIKGFAITLGIGVAANIFTGVVCTHVLIDLYILLVKPKSLPMLAMVFPPIRKLFTLNVDWVGKKWLFIGASFVLALVGVVALVVRGADFLDIEFRGGTMVAFKLAEDKTLSTAQARHRLDRQAATLAQELQNQLQSLQSKLDSAPTDEKQQLEKQIAQLKQDLDKAPDLAGSRATVVTVGQTVADQASAFSIATLHPNAKIVSEQIKAAFHDVLDAKQPIRFKDMGDPDQDAPSILDAPVYPVRLSALGDNISRPALRADVAEYLGGTITLVQDMNPPASIADVTDRIQRMRQQPKHEGLGYRTFTVVGLDQAADQPAPQNTDNQPLYRSVAVVSKDASTNYAETPDSFREPKGLADTEWALVRDALIRDTSLGSVTNFSSQVSDDMQRQAIIAIVLSWLAIMAYVWLRFGNLKFGVGAVVALIHDVFIAIGLAALSVYVYNSPLGRALGLEPFHLNLSLIAAALTLIGYSVNDTIVVFDRIRENRGRLAYLTPRIINDSINQTLSRTILTAGTVFISVLVLYAIGGTGVHGFAFVMLIGVVVGCYSSIAVASPILLIGKSHKESQTSPADHRSLTTDH